MLPGRSLRIAAAFALALMASAMAVPADAATVTIVMKDLVIAPAEASVKVGDTIEWVNKDVVAHTATAPGEFDVMLPPGKSGTFVVKKAGTLPYSCRFHPNMKAVLTVTP